MLAKKQLAENCSTIKITDQETLHILNNFELVDGENLNRDNHIYFKAKYQTESFCFSSIIGYNQKTKLFTKVFEHDCSLPRNALHFQTLWEEFVNGYLKTNSNFSPATQYLTSINNPSLTETYFLKNTFTVLDMLKRDNKIYFMIFRKEPGKEQLLIGQQPDYTTFQTLAYCPNYYFSNQPFYNIWHRIISGIDFTLEELQALPDFNSKIIEQFYDIKILN